jgi:hypothetical protein
MVANTEPTWDVIHTYTRAQAIEDGVLVDVSEMAREAGVKTPVAVTQRLWDGYITPDPRSVGWGQSIEGRLWDVLWMLSVAAHKTASNRVDFKVIFIMKEKQRRTVSLYALCGPGDDGEPVITIMLPDED